MSKRRPPLRAGRGLFAPVIVLVGAAALFAVSWQSHRSAELRSEHSRLLRERQFELDRLLHLQTRWQRATSRREIVPRAVEELQLAERVLEPREIIALRGSSKDTENGQGLGERIRSGLDRYGQIGAALADEGQQEPRP